MPVDAPEREAFRERLRRTGWNVKRAFHGIAQSSRTWAALGLVALLVVPVLLWMRDPTLSLPNFDPILLSINVAVAVFSINLSLSIPRSSTYRDLHTDTPARHVFMILAILGLATTPIAATVLAQKYLTNISLTALILVTYSGVALLAIARHETNPETIIGRDTAEWRVRGYFDDVFDSARATIREQEADPLVEVRDMPMHEVSHAVALPPPGGPVRRLEHLATLSATADDAETYRDAFGSLLSIIERAHSYTAPPPRLQNSEYKARKVFDAITRRPLLRVTAHVLKVDHTGYLSSLSVDLIAQFITSHLRTHGRAPEFAGLLFRVSWKFARHLLATGAAGNPRTHIITIRQVIEREAKRLAPHSRREDPPEPTTVDVTDESASPQEPAAAPHADGEEDTADDVPADPPPRSNEVEPDQTGREFADPMDRFQIAWLATLIKDAGEDAANDGKVDYLYRCLEALSYTGCTAMRRDLDELAKECARGLCYLGRVARARDLECHWDKCMLTPTQHAAENIGHMVSWLLVLPAADRPRWQRRFEEVFSRLHGYACTLEIDETTTPPTISLGQNRGRPHRSSFASSTASRTLDYSDPTMLKDVDWL